MKSWRLVLRVQASEDGRKRLRGGGRPVTWRGNEVQKVEPLESKYRGSMKKLEYVIHPVRLSKALAKEIARKLWKRYDTIGPYRIRVPINSRIYRYKRRFKLHDTQLGNVARVVHTKYPGLCAIDIGANVGDTAALIRKAGDIPVLCIEGDPQLLPLLEENAAVMGSGITIERSFVGADGQAVCPSLIIDPGRNASLRAAIRDDGSIKLRSLGSILGDHPAFWRAKLLKTDTEGFDFDILRQSLEFIRHAKPVIFFEYDPGLKPAEQGAGLRTLGVLKEAGYSDFLYFDNYGNFLVHANAAQVNILADLDHYLASNRTFGVAVYYFDICAFHEEDGGLARDLRNSTQADVA